MLIDALIILAILAAVFIALELLPSRINPAKEVTPTKDGCIVDMGTEQWRFTDNSRSSADNPD